MPVSRFTHLPSRMMMRTHPSNGQSKIILGHRYRLWGWCRGGQPRNTMDAEILPTVWYWLFIPHQVIQVRSWEGLFMILSLFLALAGAFC